MPQDNKQDTGGRKAVGIYDRPATADLPKRTILVVAIIVVVAIAAYLLMR